MSSAVKLIDGQGEALFYLKVQASFTFLLLLLAHLSVGLFEGLWLGSAIVCMANSFFYRWVFSHEGAQKLACMMRAIYVGQCGKWVISIALFSVIFKLALTDAFSVLLGYSLAQLLNSLLPLSQSLFKTDKSK